MNIDNLNNTDVEVIEEFIDEELLKKQAEIKANQEYAELAVKANAENKVIYTHENGEHELIGQLTYQTSIFNGNEWVQDKDKLAQYQEQIRIQNESVVHAIIDDINNEIRRINDELDEDINDDLSSYTQEQIQALNDKKDELKLYRRKLCKLDLNVEHLVVPPKP